jgi:HlyD family secretion protein
VKCQEGQLVKSGSLVALLDAPENTIKAQQSEISVKNAENELAKLNEGSRNEDIKAQEALTKQAQAGVKQAENAFNQGSENLIAAQTTYDFKKKTFDDTQVLYDSDTASKQELDNAKYALDTAQSALTNAQYAKETAKQQVESAKALYTAATEKLDLLKNGVTEKTKTTAQYGITQAEQGYSLSKLLLDKANIVALSDGIVESVNYSVGEYVTPGSTVVTIVNPNDMWVKIYLPEKILPLVKLNKEVIIKSDFIPGQTIKGRISYIATEAEFTPMNIVTKKDRQKLVFAVKVKILDHLDVVKPGMLLDIDLK